MRHCLGTKRSLFNKVGDRQLYKNLSPESIREEVEASLQRLGIDYIDIYMTHWQSVPPFLRRSLKLSQCSMS